MSINQVFNINALGSKVKILNFIATQLELLELSKLLDILKTNSLSFEGKLFKENNYIFLIATIKANINQECSVSLDLIVSDLEIQINKKYQIIPKNNNYSKEIVISLNDDDDEELENNSIDLKKIIEEEMILNVDPYIKKFHLIED
jgi:uncharacterized metal-binding protein YceD (DUF177 family)